MKTVLLLLLPGALLCQTQPPIAPDKSNLDGHVFNSATGEPLRKARLTLRLTGALAPGAPRPQNPTAVRSVTAVTDPTGRFEFLGVDPGTYNLTARHAGFEDTQYGVKKGGRPAEPLILAAGDRKTGADIRMTPYGAIAGRLLDEDGDPIQGFHVSTMVYQYTAKGRTLVERNSASTDDLGDYRIYNVPPGRYYLKVGPQSMRGMGRAAEGDESFAITYYPGSQDPAGAAPIDLAAGAQMRGINFALHPAHAATLRGRVIKPAGCTQVSVGLMVVTDNGSSSTNNTNNDPEGKFELFGISPGATFVTADCSVADKRYSARVALQVGTADINGIDLIPVAPMDFPAQVRIEGTTQTKLSQVRLTLQGQGRYGQASVNDDGSASFKAVTPDAYTVSVNNMAGLYIKSVRWGDTDITDTTLDLTGGVGRNELTVTLGADVGEITGSVVNEKSEPFDSATVTLVPTGTHRSRPFYRTARTDATGHFSMKAIAPGSYKLFAWDEVDPNAVMFDPDFLRPYESKAVRLDVAENEKKSQELKLIYKPAEQ